MALITKKIKGTEDVLPKQSYRWQFVENIMREESRAYGFREMRTPVFEHTELFARGVGQTTDVVQKEMYTFDTKGGESVTLRPEGTAGAARAVLEHALENEGLPIKASYFVSCYRYEKPQAGRLREFHQFGVEEFGTQSPIADAELICLAQSVLDRLGLTGAALHHLPVALGEESHAPARLQESRGSQNRRGSAQNYRLSLRGMRGTLCRGAALSHRRRRCLYRQPHYTKTVFEFVTDCIGAQGTVCGGGRYDGLIEELGGRHLPSLGFAMGLERILMVMDAQGIEIPQPEPCALYIATMGDAAKVKAFSLLRQVRECGLSAETDVVGRGLRPQMKYADKLGARYSMVLGDNEIEQNKAKVKNMETGEQTELALDETFAEKFSVLKLTESVVSC